MLCADAKWAAFVQISRHPALFRGDIPASEFNSTGTGQDAGRQRMEAGNAHE